MTVNMHYMCHALLFQCIFANEYSRLLAPHHSQANCNQANVNKIVELNMSLVYCVVQSSFHDLRPHFLAKGDCYLYMNNPRCGDEAFSASFVREGTDVS